MTHMFRENNSLDLRHEAIWTEYRENKLPEVRRELVIRYLGLIRYVMAKFGLDHAQKSLALDREDIFEFGVLGLLDAVDRYTPTTGVKFETYAISRIRGAMVDEMRKLDWIPRSVRKNTRVVSDVAAEIESETGREPLDTEIADKLMISLEQYEQLVKETIGLTSSGRDHGSSTNDLNSVNDLLEHQATDVDKSLDDDEGRTYIINAIESLPNRERVIVALHYYEGLKFSEVGTIMHLSEGRVSQIHGAVLKMLRTKLAELQL